MRMAGPSRAPEPGPPGPPGPAVLANRVIVGMDDHPASLAALRFAATQAAYRGGDVLAVNVGLPGTGGMPGLEAAVTGVLRERAAAGRQTVPITAQAVSGVAAPTLIAAARGSAMLVLGARRHHRVLTSLVESWGDGPPCPVVVVPDPDRPRIRADADWGASD